MSVIPCHRGGHLCNWPVCHDNAGADDRCALHRPIGFVLNAIGHEVGRARAGYEGLYRRGPGGRKRRKRTRRER